MAVDLPTVRRGAPAPLAEQIAAHYRAAIAATRLRPGDRLPTIRAVADGIGTTRTTVQAAYKRLADEGLVHAVVGRGTVVAEPASGIAPSPLSPAAEAAFLLLQNAPSLPEPTGELVADFARLQPDPALFPVDAFRAAIDRVLRRHGGDLLGYGDPRGREELREVLATRHSAVPGRAVDASRVLITSGAQQGIELVLRTFARPGDAVAVAIPTYHQLFGALEALGLRIVPIESPRGIADPAAVERTLARPDVRLLYVMPTFHNPTGETLSVEARRTLMDVVAATDVPVLEDEFECELRFEGDELPTLQSMDPRGLTATVRTFSKGLFPGVRVGWVEAPAPVLGPMTAIKRFSDLESSSLLQAALFEFVQSGAMDDYLDRLRAELRTRHVAAREACAEHMPDGTRWTTPAGGFAFWLELPPGTDGDQVTERAARDGVLVTPGRFFDPLHRPSRGLRLALARTDTSRVRTGIGILARHALDPTATGHESLSDPPPLIL